jgi:hypothetical protein
MKIMEDSSQVIPWEISSLKHHFYRTFLILKKIKAGL